MDKPHLSIIITGHLDHGKSTLIGRLLLDTNSLSKEKIGEINQISEDLGKGIELAYLTDQLKEERVNSMTIDTTQTFFKTCKANYILIDSPGHKEFIKNMLTGATQANAAVLIVDTREGMKDQTFRHAYLLNMLGIRNLVVVFNKMDLLRYRQAVFIEKKSELMVFFENLRLKPSFIIPISAKDGVNISKQSRKTAWYKGKTLLEALDSIASKVEPSNKPLRLPIQDIYKIDGKKIIVGQIISGQIKTGDEVTLMPSLRKVTVRSLCIFGKSIKKAADNQNIGVVLDNTRFAKRGEIIAQSDKLPIATNYFRGNIFWISEDPLKLGENITLRCATQKLTCSVKRIEKRINSSTLQVIQENAKELKTNETGIVFFETQKPIVIEKLDYIAGLGRFVVEQRFNVKGAGIIP